MNNIEILEEYIKELNKNKKRHELVYSTGFGKYWLDFSKAIENLIQRNKNLEQIEKEHKEENGRLRDRIKELEKIDLTTVYMDGIYDERNKWIINVKEKMNKDIKTNEHIILGGRRNGKTLEYGIRLGRIQMCEELLEESEK